MQVDAARQTVRTAIYTYATGAEAKLAAIPRPGYRFTGWSGSTSEAAETITLTMTCPKDVTANFVPGQFRLTTSVSPPTTGTIELLPPQPVQGYSTDTIVTITARPARGHVLKEWSGDVAGSEKVRTLLIDSEKSVSATFAQKPSGVWNWVWGGAGIVVIGIMAYLVVSGRR